MRKTARIIVSLIITGLAVSSINLFAQDDAKTPTYIGSSKCKMCHKGEKNGTIYEIWESSVHAKSMATLVEKGEQNNPECLSCHTTGHGVPGGFGTEGMEAADALGAVGCEACHGPGSEYKSKKTMESRELSLAAGLVLPNEATCVKCHNDKSPTFKGFNFAEAYAKIIHKLPPKVEGEGSGEGSGGH